MFLKEIIEASRGKTVGFKNIKICGISIDSRTIKKGEAFIALEGNQFDGHDFVDKAFEKGASCAIISRKIGKTKSRAILVPDTLRALGDIARFHRLKFNITVIAITGSAGKTTAKEIICHILSKKYNVHKNEGTKNNLVGLPLTLLGLRPKHDMCIVEMGTNRPGEIKRLSDIARPQVGIITNIGPTHLEFLGDVKNVFKEKFDLLEALNEESLAVLNADDNFLKKAGAKGRTLYFGLERPCDFRAINISTKAGNISFTVGKYHFRAPLLGRHNVYNALVGIAVGKVFGIKTKDIAGLLSDFKNPFKDRLTWSKCGKIDVLNDSYNSNPLSFVNAIDSLESFSKKRRRIVIAGDMLELGKKSKRLHTEIGARIAESGVKIFLATGKKSRHACSGALKKGMKSVSVMYFDNQEDLIKAMPKVLHKGDVVLVKGSRGTRMDRVAECLSNFSLK